jgi:hypothetical protein
MMCTPLSPPGVSMAIIYDLKHESGIAEIVIDALSAREMIERDPERYKALKDLPPGTKLGPKRGQDRIVL